MKNNLPGKFLALLSSNQFLSLAGNLAVSGMSIVSVSLLFRALPMQETGVWVFFLTMTGLVDSFRAGFVTTAFIRAYSGAAAARATEVVGSTWAVAGGITGLLILLILLLVNLLAFLKPSVAADEGFVLFRSWFGLAALFSLPAFIAANVLQAELRFGRLLVLRLLSQGLFVVAIIGLMLTHQARLELVVYVYLLASAATSLVALLLGWTRLAAIRNRTGACIRELIHFGKYSVGSYIGASLLRSSDTFIIKIMLGDAPLAVYNLAQRFLEIIEIPLRSTLATAIPALSAAFNQHDKPQMVEIFNRNAGVLTWALAPVAVGVVLFADLPVYLLGGAKYADSDAANLLRIFILMAVLFPIDRFTGVTLDVLNKPHLNLIKVFLMLAINVSGDFIGIHYLNSIYGVALASLPSILSGFIFGYFLLKKSLPISIGEVLRTGFREGEKLLAVFLKKPSSPNPY